jgi:hypothetical protein
MIYTVHDAIELIDFDLNLFFNVLYSYCSMTYCTTDFTFGG